jgi:tetratricopeptide (TPR) repeat protein
VLFGWWRAGQDEEAAEAIGAVLTSYEQGDYATALDGTAGQPGLLAIADEYGSTDTGNLAAFYAADALYQLGRYEEALTYFERYDAGADLLGASALAGEAAIHEQQGDYAEAAALYERAADAYESAATTPDYLIAAGRNYEAAGDLDEAKAVYERYLDAYEDAPAAPIVEALVAKVEAEAR